MTEENMTALERELTLMVRRVLRGLWTADHGPDIDHTVFPLLVALRDEGPMRTGELARYFRLDKSTVSRHIARLEAAGLVETRPDPNDRRCAQLHMTPDGLARVDEIRAARRAPLRQVLDGWSDADRDQLAQLLRRLNTAMSDRETAVAGARRPS
ncbi:MAG TPA: MarR family transcriptional regulator [Candidatus Dormibacteraeota bacterium]|nr:MarR family transcriptional regulator [Candidatus Dormibacteraeota bacterium]